MVSFLLPVATLDHGHVTTPPRPELWRKDGWRSSRHKCLCPWRETAEDPISCFLLDVAMLAACDRELLGPSFHDTEDTAEDSRVKKWNNLTPCWHYWAALSINLGVHPSSELPVMRDNKVPYYSSQRESGFLLLVAKSVLADTVHQTTEQGSSGTLIYDHLALQKLCTQPMINRCTTVVIAYV